MGQLVTRERRLQEQVNCEFCDQQRRAIDDERQTIEAQRRTIEEERQTIEAQRRTIEEERQTIAAQRRTIEEQRSTIEEQRRTIQDQRLTIGELQNHRAERMLAALPPIPDGFNHNGKFFINTNKKNLFLLFLYYFLFANNIDFK